MGEYKLPSGRASVETEGGSLSEVNYSYNATGKDKTIQELLNECLKLQAKVEELENAPVAYGLANDVDILQAKVEELTAALEQIKEPIGWIAARDIAMAALKDGE